MKKSKHKEKIALKRDSNSSDKQASKEIDLSGLDWSGIKGDSIGTNTHNLKILDKDTLAFEQTILLLQSSRIFLSIGMVMIGLPIIMWGAAIPLIIFGSAFIFFGLLIKGLGSRSFVFDRYNKIYRGEVHRREDPWVSFFYKKVKDTSIDFDKIIAVQFLSQVASSDDDSHDLYQTNLVLHDKSRINIVNYSKETTARKDATYLAEFLNVPFLERE